MSYSLPACTFIALLLVNSTATADEKIGEAIDRGAKFLSALHRPAEEYNGGTHHIGSACLVGLALLESGNSPDDASLKNISDFVRFRALRQARTYEVSIAIMFLDRLGNPADTPVIQLLAAQLIAAQSASGGWTYDAISYLDDVDRVYKSFYGDNRLRTKQTPPFKPKGPLDRVPALHPEALRQLRAVDDMLAKMGIIPNSNSDLSNTQFAVLALWIARKHGVPTDRALSTADKGMRAVQNKDGGWSYNLNEPASNSRATMACSGLMTIAIGRGVRSNNANGKPPESLLLDPAVVNGFKYIEKAIEGSDKENATDHRGNLYFLWSLERVAMIFDTHKIGAADWYKWGSEYLLNTQDKDGSWPKSTYDGANAEINTAFALLFLNRANLAKDLTATLRGTGKAKINLPEPIKVDPKQGPTASDSDAEANRLCAELVKANATNRLTILAKLRDTKGTVYTEALVRAIAKLQGEQQRQAREALALRLKRMTALTLREMLKDENREIRNAAASACGLKDDKQFIADLIAVLNDTEPLVVQTARNSLRSLSGKDFGPQSDSNAEDKAKAVADWKAWLAAQPK